MTHFGSAVNENFMSVIGADFAVNKINDIMFPTSGYTLNFVIEEANLIPKLIDKLTGSNLTNSSLFYKTLVTWAWFPKIYASDKNAFGIKFKIGHMQAYSGEANGIPITKTFYSGGSNSVRGWRTRELIPSKRLNISGFSYQDLIDYYLKNAPLGGLFMFEGSFETRNRLFGPFGGAAFIDYGNVLDNYKKFTFDKIAVAAGFGLRFYLEFFAPIRIDFGFRVFDPDNRNSFFTKKIFKDTFQMQLGIGEAF
jgi:outer membrane protein insertion porin family